MDEAPIILTLLILIGTTNGYVTYRVAKSDYFDLRQKYYQYALILLVPVIGAIVCYVFSRDSTEPHGGKYPEERPYDFDASGNYIGGNSFGGEHGGHGGEVGD